MSEITDVISKLKEFKRLKRSFSSKYSTPERIVQKAIDQVCSYAVTTGGGQISSDQLVNLARPEDSTIHEIFDWSQSEGYRLQQADAILQMMEYFFTTNNKLFKIEKV